MTPKQAHNLAREEIVEAGEGCSVDYALERFALRILEHYGRVLDRALDGEFPRWDEDEDLRDYIEGGD